MTKINFYRISGGIEDALSLCCQLAEKAAQQSLSVLFHAEQDVAEKLRQLLETFKPASSSAHRATDNNQRNVAIISENDPGEHHGLLVSLTPETPRWFSRFEKAVEIVYDDSLVMEKKRDSYRHYKSRGYPLHYIDLTKS